MTALEDLTERIQLRLEESFAGISQVVAELPAPDVADLLNRLKVVEAATVITMVPVPRAVEVMNSPR